MRRGAPPTARYGTRAASAFSAGPVSPARVTQAERHFFDPHVIAICTVHTLDGGSHTFLSPALRGEARRGKARRGERPRAGPRGLHTCAIKGQLLFEMCDGQPPSASSLPPLVLYAFSTSRPYYEDTHHNILLITNIRHHFYIIISIRPRPTKQ